LELGGGGKKAGKLQGGNISPSKKLDPGEKKKAGFPTTRKLRGLGRDTFGGESKTHQVCQTAGKPLIGPDNRGVKGGT